MTKRVCDQCGTSINLLRAGARFCGVKCRVYHSRGVAKPAGVPAELKVRARWIRHTARKVPLTVAGGAASSTDAATWSTHAEAVASGAGVGLGFVLNGDGVGCIDLDHALVDGKPTAATQAILDRHPGAYVEVSPSGDGLHIWGLAACQAGRRYTEAGQAVEFYTTGRYMTVTGNVYQAGGLTPLRP